MIKAEKKAVGLKKTLIAAIVLVLLVALAVSMITCLCSSSKAGPTPTVSQAPEEIILETEKPAAVSPADEVTKASSSADPTTPMITTPASSQEPTCTAKSTPMATPTSSPESIPTATSTPMATPTSSPEPMPSNYGPSENEGPGMPDD